jgi:hypothetical protein
MNRSQRTQKLKRGIVENYLKKINAKDIFFRGLANQLMIAILTYWYP